MIILTLQDAFSQTTALEFPLGADKSGSLVKADLTEINHLLVSGTIGSGKSVFIDSMLLTLTTHNSPEKLRLLLCDTKGTEFLPYSTSGHLLIPVCTDAHKIAAVLQWVQTEIQNRLRIFAETKVRNISSYNGLAWEAFGNELPHIIIVVDDLSTVVNQCPESVSPIKQVLSAGRTAGIHLIAVTQTPMVKNTKDITSLFFSKVVFQSASTAELRHMTGQRNPMRLIHTGDALFCSGTLIPVKAIMPNTKDFECLTLADGTQYDATIINAICPSPPDKNDYDALLPNAIEIVVETGMASVSMLQRRLELGYSRAAHLVDQMEEKGIVGPFEGSMPRKVLITKEQWQILQHEQGLSIPALVPEPPTITKTDTVPPREPASAAVKDKLYSATQAPRKKACFEISMNPRFLRSGKPCTVSIDDNPVGQLNVLHTLHCDVEEGLHKLSFLVSGNTEKETMVRVHPTDEIIRFSIELDLFGRLKLYKAD